MKNVVFAFSLLSLPFLSQAAESVPVEISKWQAVQYGSPEASGVLNVTDAVRSENSSDGEGCWIFSMIGDTGAPFGNLGMNALVEPGVDLTDASAISFSVKVKKHEGGLPSVLLELSNLSGRPGSTVQLRHLKLLDDEEWHEVEVPLSKTSEEISAVGKIKCMTLLFMFQGVSSTDMTVKIRGVQLKR